MFLNIFVDFIRVFWLPVFLLIYDILYELTGVAIYSVKYLTDVVELFMQIFLIGT